MAKIVVKMKKAKKYDICVFFVKKDVARRGASFFSERSPSGARAVERGG